MQALPCGAGLHTGVRVPAAPSVSGVPWRYPPQRSSGRGAPAPLRPAASPGPGSSGGDGSASSSSSGGAGGQAYRFKHVFQPGRTYRGELPPDSWAGWPTDAAPYGTPRAAFADESVRVDPARELWPRRGPVAGAARLANPWASHFRVARVDVPVPVSLPGAEYWHVEALNDYSKNWPSLKLVDGKLQFRKGFLERVDDPKVVPFFFYRGLESISYSLSDRAFQALFTAVYAGVHLALFRLLWASQPSLALAVGLNWGLGRLSLGKWGVLLLLASSGRLWLYWLWQAGRLVDAGLARLFPPVRRVAWALFSMWLLFVAVTPSYFYPLPFAPFAPGTLGAQEALM